MEPKNLKRPAPVYFLSYNKNTVACYTQAWRVLACMRVMCLEGYNDFSQWRVVCYRLAKDSEFAVERTVVTDSFLKALSSYGVSSRI